MSIPHNGAQLFSFSGEIFRWARASVQNGSTVSVPQYSNNHLPCP
jgi:hypothetical protein